MTEEQINKAAAFLMTSRTDDLHTPPAQRHDQAAAEIRNFLRIQTAIKMAGLASAISMTQMAVEPAPPADDILTCTQPGCGWVGHEDSRASGALGMVHCPNCGGITFERAAV